jgi:hypothetical protein
MKRPSPDRRKVYVAFSLDPLDLATIRALAKDAATTQSGALRRIIAEWVTTQRVNAGPQVNVNYYDGAGA